MSAPIRPTRWPCIRNARARLAATVDLPTPPLPLATAMSDLTPGSAIFGGMPCGGCMGVPRGVCRGADGGPSKGVLSADWGGEPALGEGDRVAISGAVTALAHRLITPI